jgi:hypothetical protein
MDRIYTNHRTGERRIHIEIDEQEIADLVAESGGRPLGPATASLLAVLRQAHEVFTTGRR